MKKTSFEDALILSAIRTAQFFSRILPYPVSLRVGSWIGDVAYFFSKRQTVMKRNLRAVFAAEKSPRELDAIARQSLRNLGRSGIELLRVPSMDLKFVEKNVKVVGRAKVDEALSQGKGVILLTAHFGSWELLNIFSSILGYPMVALAREQKHPRSDAFLNDLRRSKGSEVIYKGMPVREILRALRKGNIVGILSDQDAGRNGVFVRFFGRLSSYPKGFAAFSLRTGAPILPAFIFREGIDRHRVEVEGPLLIPPDDLSDEDKEKFILQQFASILESKIRKDPAQWLWAHRRWKSTPDRFVIVLSDGKAGHRNQSLAMAEAIAVSRKAEGFSEQAMHKKVIEVEFKSEASRNIHRGLYRVLGGRVPWARFWAKKFLRANSYHEIMGSYADIVISAGSSVAGVNLWCTKENKAKSVVIMDPGIGTSCFNAVIAPRHDGVVKRANVYQTRGALTGVTRERLEKEAAELRSDLHLDANGKTIGLLIGGDTMKVQFQESVFVKMLRNVERACKDQQAQLLASTSRRTPAWADKALKNVLDGQKHCALLVIANEANRDGIVQGILGLADIIVVSGESISMVSEAVSAGKHVIVIEPFDSTSLKSKHRAFLSQMEKEALISRAGAQELYGKIVLGFQGLRQNRGILAGGEDEDLLREVAQKISR